MSTSFAQDARPRTSVVDQLTALGVKVHPAVEYGPRHRFDHCAWCGAVDAVANCTVYPRDDVTRECCTWCVVDVTEQAIVDSAGRFEYVTVEIGVVADPAPSVILNMRDRSSDLDNPRCEKHWSTATFVVQTEQHERKLCCDECLGDTLRGALTSGGFMPGAVSAVDLDTYAGWAVAA